jgi:DNA-binding transcriptional LysR family regulator
LERFTGVLDLLEPPLALAPFQMQLFWHPRMRRDPAHSWLRKQLTESARLRR